jgi:hypothetical protein
MLEIFEDALMREKLIDEEGMLRIMKLTSARVAALSSLFWLKKAFTFTESARGAGAARGADTLERRDLLASMLLDKSILF